MTVRCGFARIRLDLGRYRSGCRGGCGLLYRLDDQLAQPHLAGFDLPALAPEKLPGQPLDLPPELFVLIDQQLIGRVTCLKHAHKSHTAIRLGGNFCIFNRHPFTERAYNKTPDPGNRANRERLVYPGLQKSARGNRKPHIGW